MTLSFLQLVGFNQYNRDKWVASIARCLLPGMKVLDLGAGECRYRELFSHCDYMAQDFCRYQGTRKGILREEWSYGKVDYISDAGSIPIKNGSYDVVLCTEVLEHVPEPTQVLKEIGRILRVGGFAYITAPLGSGLHQQPYHFYGGFTPHYYKHFLPELGFEIVSIEPNGRFFRMLLQEMNRGIEIIQTRLKYPIWHPMRLVLKILSSRGVAEWLTCLDEEIPIDEFTVGYHIEARKL